MLKSPVEQSAAGDDHHPVVYDDYLIGTAIDNRSDANRSLYDHYFAPDDEVGG